MKIAPMNVDLVDHMGTDLTVVNAARVSLTLFARVCKERLASGAQAETRDVASLIAREVELLFPVSWNALMGGVG